MPIPEQDRELEILCLNPIANREYIKMTALSGLSAVKLHLGLSMIVF